MEENQHEESAPLLDSKVDPTSEISPNLGELRSRSVRTKVPEVEVNLYKQGKGPIAVFQARLGGWDQDQLEVREILDQYGFKSLYAFNPVSSSRSVPLRFHPRNGRSLLSYRDGSVLHLDGEPKDSLIKPVTRIIVGGALITILIAVVVSESPRWAEKFSLKNTRIPPWLLTCAIIVFTRMRKRTKDFLQKRGWLKSLS